MKSIGGYFSLELPHNTFGELYPSAIKLNAARYCLEYILRARGYRKIYIPYYTCDSVLQPIKAVGIEYDFYHIDSKLHIAEKVDVRKNEVLLYTDYYGLMDKYTRKVAYDYYPNVIIDNTQAFFTKPVEHVDTFNTCRKYFGVPDGAYLFTDACLDRDIPQDHSAKRMEALLGRLDSSAEEYFSKFHDMEQSIQESGMKRMSTLTQAMMDSIDYDEVARRRLSNYHRLDSELSKDNELHFSMDYGVIPMVYPYYCHKSGLRKRLIENKIYVAKYWPNVLDWAGAGSVEADLVENLLPLPIDQRYGEDEMDFIIEKIKNF